MIISMCPQLWSRKFGYYISEGCRQYYQWNLYFQLWDTKEKIEIIYQAAEGGKFLRLNKKTPLDKEDFDLDEGGGFI